MVIVCNIQLCLLIAFATCGFIDGGTKGIVAQSLTTDGIALMRRFEGLSLSD